MDQGPVYVGGLERSGTSLIYALLASHSRIAMTRRTNLWTHFYGQYGDLSDDANFDRCFEMMMRYRRLVVLDLDADRLHSEFMAGERSYGRLFDLLERQVADRLAKPRWGDKSLNTERYAGPIFEAFPGARIIHMVRDPRDRYASSKTRWKRRRGGVGAGVAEWLDSVALAEKNKAAHPDGYMTLRYEDLVQEPERWVRAVCDFIGEEYEPAMLDMEGASKFKEQGSNSSYGSREVGVISTDSIGRYRQVLATTDIAFVDRVAGSEMRRLDYGLEEIQLRGRDLARFVLVDLPLDSGRLMAWRASNAYKNWKGRPLPAYRIVTPETTP